MDTTPRLPRCVTKYELSQDFDCNYEFLWREILTEDLLTEWGYGLDYVKQRKRFGPLLTRQIYLHFRITDLNRSLAEEITAELAVRPEEGEQAA